MAKQNQTTVTLMNNLDTAIEVVEQTKAAHEAADAAAVKAKAAYDEAVSKAETLQHALQKQIAALLPAVMDPSRVRMSG